MSIRSKIRRTDRRIANTLYQLQNKKEEDDRLKYADSLFSSEQKYFILMKYNWGNGHYIVPIYKQLKNPHYVHGSDIFIPVRYSANELLGIHSSLVLPSVFACLEEKDLEHLTKTHFKINSRTKKHTEEDTDLATFKLQKKDYTLQQVFYYLQKCGYSLKMPAINCLTKRFFIADANICDNIKSLPLHSYYKVAETMLNEMQEGYRCYGMSTSIFNLYFPPDYIKSIVTVDELCNTPEK